MGRERALFHLSIAFAVFPHLFIFVFGMGRLEVPGAMEMQILTSERNPLSPEAAGTRVVGSVGGLRARSSVPPREGGMARF